MITKKLLKQNFGHRCSLPKENIMDEILPGKQWRTKLRRFYHKTFMVCESNPRTKHFCTSQKKLVLEKIGHMTEYPFTIHPTCPFRMFWDPFMIVVNIITLLYFPFNGAFCIDLPSHIRQECDSRAILTFNIICIIDIILNFFTICYDKEKVIVDYKSIAKNYLKGFFIMDLISSVPNIILPFLHVQQINLWVILLQFFRVFNLIHYLSITAKLLFIGPNTLRFLIIFLCFFLLVHWAACTSIIVTVLENHLVSLGVPDRKSWMTFNGLWNTSTKLIYINSLFRSVCFFAGSGDVEVSFSKNHAVQPFQWLLSKVFFAVFVGALMQALISTFNHKFQYKKTIYKINQFSNKKLLSKDLNKRLICFIDFKYSSKAIIKENKIFENISLKMKQDIIVGNRLRYLSNISYLGNLPSNLLRALCIMFCEHLYMAGDIILRTNYNVQHFYLIVSGTAACYSSKGFELYHMTEGDYCGDIELLFPDSKTTRTVVALENCRIFSLNHKDFLVAIQAFSKFPELMEYIKRKILEHTQRISSLEKQLSQWKKERTYGVETV